MRTPTPVQTTDSDDVTASDPCANCGAELHGAYCHVCGQRVRNESLRFSDLGVQFARTFLDLDQGVLYTVRELLLRPGTVPLRYLEGERVRFVGPLTAFLLGATVSFLSFEWYEADFIRLFADTVRTIPAAGFSEGGVMFETFGATSPDHYGTILIGLLKSFYSYVGIVNALVIAAVLRLFTSRWTTAELLVFELYTFAVVYTLAALASPLLIGSVGGYFVGSQVFHFVVHVVAGIGFFTPSVSGAVKAGFAYVIGAFLYNGLTSMLVFGLMIFR